MEIITITKENLNNEHICCAISNKDDIQVTSKKSWIAERLDDGLVFKKGDVRGKCFIEYIPAEKAWAPIEAAGYMYIDCLWVSGQFKGQGNSSILLEECIRDSKEKGKKGLVVLSSKKKVPFIADPKYLRHKGFKLADSADPYFELLYFPFDKTAEIPQFKQSVKERNQEGIDKINAILEKTVEGFVRFDNFKNRPDKNFWVRCQTKWSPGFTGVNYFKIEDFKKSHPGAHLPKF